MKIPDQLAVMTPVEVQTMVRENYLTLWDYSEELRDIAGCDQWQ